MSGGGEVSTNYPSDTPVIPSGHVLNTSTNIPKFWDHHEQDVSPNTKRTGGTGTNGNSIVDEKTLSSCPY